MDGFWGFLKIGCVGVLALFALFLVLLAMPQSRLRSLVLEILGWTGTAGSALMVVSPIDWIPDPIIGLGQMDDLAMLAVGIGCLVMALQQHKARGRFEQQEEARRLN